MDMSSLTADQWKRATTFTGVPLDKIRRLASKPWPEKAKKAIPVGPMKGKTDIAFHYTRRRIERIFGLQGIGWRIVPHPTLGKVNAVADRREGRDYWTVTLEAHVFEFAVLLPDNGGIVWMSSSPMSDAYTSNNGGAKGYVFRGAATALLKQVLRGWGGFDSLYGTEGDDEPDGEEGEKLSTGLEAITAATKVADASWAWLDDNKALDKLLRTFGAATFGELPDTVTDFLFKRRNLPPELAAYLVETRKSAAPAKPPAASPESGSKTGSAAPKSSAKPADKEDKVETAAGKSPAASAKDEASSDAAKPASAGKTATPPASAAPAKPGASGGKPAPVSTAKPADGKKGGWPGPDMKADSTPDAPEGDPQPVTEPGANGAAAK